MEPNIRSQKEEVEINYKVGAIKIDLEPPRLIPVRGFNKKLRRWEEWILRVTDKRKIHLL